MNFKKNGGFTLVELIVVIAILGILAGIGIPAYGKYVEKTQIAVEEQNINMFHNAFVVACVGNGADPAEFRAVGVDMTNGVFKGLTSLTRAGDNDIVNDFNAFFGFPTTTYEFKYLADKVATGILKGLETEGGSATSAIGGIFTNLNSTSETFKNAVTSIQNSTFGEIGAQGLMTRVDTVTGLAAGLAGVNENFVSVLENNIEDLALALGYDASDLAEDDGAFWAKYGEMVAEIQKNDPTLSESEAGNQLLANYAVMIAAKQGTGKDASSELNRLTGTSFDVESVKNLLKGDDADQTQQGIYDAAMMYAMYTAYANQLDDNDTNKEAAMAGTTDLGAFVEILGNDENPNYTGFYAYLNDTNGQAQKDMAGYLGALNIINESTATEDSEAVVEDLLINGYTDTNLVGSLNDLLGK